MARFPGTEVQHNRAGFEAGQVVRFRRSRANDELGLADRRGFVSEVRPGHVRVLLDPEGKGQWIESGAVLPERDLQDPDMAALHQAYTELGAVRLEVDSEEWAFFSEGFDGQALDPVREALHPRLQSLTVTCHGVHELAVRMRLGPPSGSTDSSTP